jgi:hypothetical protein
MVPQYTDRTPYRDRARGTCMHKRALEYALEWYGIGNFTSDTGLETLTSLEWDGIGNLV